MGKTSKQIVYDIMNITSGLSNHFLAHTMGTIDHFEEDEFNFFKERRDIGLKAAIHARNKFYDRRARQNGFTNGLPFTLLTLVAGWWEYLGGRSIQCSALQKACLEAKMLLPR
jgi:hypothetical protein